MTNEEAIEELKSKMVVGLEGVDDAKIFEAYNKAIEALKKQPCEECISRKDAIQVIDKYFKKYLNLNSDICLDGLRSLPSVKPTRAKGEWKHSFDKYFPYECSECGDTVESKTDFCPYCGADMRGEENENCN